MKDETFFRVRGVLNGNSKVEEMLDARDLDILRKWFWLSPETRRFTLPEIGILYGISGSRVMQLRNRAMLKLMRAEILPVELWKDAHTI